MPECLGQFLASVLLLNVYVSLYRKLIPVDSLTCENVLYWRALCEFVKSKGNEGEELLEQLLPEAAIFAEYLCR